MFQIGFSCEQRHVLVQRPAPGLHGQKPLDALPYRLIGWNGPSPPLEHVDELKGGTDGTGEARDKLLVDTIVEWCLEELGKPSEKRARPGHTAKHPEAA